MTSHGAWPDETGQRRRCLLGVDHDIRPRRWPWLVAIVVAALGVLETIHYRAVSAQEAYEQRYPIVSSAAEAQLIARGLARWRVSAVVAGVAAPPSLDTLQLLDPCDVRSEGLWRYRVGDVEMVKDIVAIPLEEAHRGRYRTEDDRTWVLAHLTNPILVTSVTSYDAPHLPALGADYHRGSRSGVAYLFDIDGTLLCAGSYAAASSESVDLSFAPNAFPPAYQLSLTRAKLVGDLEDQTALAIAKGLRRAVRTAPRSLPRPSPAGATTSIGVRPHLGCATKNFTTSTPHTNEAGCSQRFLPSYRMRAPLLLGASPARSTKTPAFSSSSV
jgi:hypothetical protein